MTRNTWLIAVTACLATQGCTALEPDGPGGSDPDVVNPGGDDVNPDPDPDPQTPDLATEGTYQLVTTFDVTAGVLAPGQIYDALALLEEFRAAPSATLVTVLDDAGVPLLADLMAILPGALEDRLLGWIDEYINGALASSGAGAAIDRILALADTSLAQFDAISELDLSALEQGAGDVAAVHRIDALAFTLDGRDLAVSVPAVDRVTSVMTTARIELEAPDLAAGDASLAIGDHTFGLPYGEFVYEALNAWMVAEYGADLRGALGGWIDCPALAASVANRCVLTVCVGHEQELEQICEQGLDLVVAEVQAEFEEMRFDALQLAAGGAVLRDTDAEDGVDVADTIADGAWDAVIDAGIGPREIDAAFIGSRL